MKHAKYSPSGAERWLKCPASVKYNNSNTTSKASLKGTVQHILVAESLQHPLGFDLIKGILDRKHEIQVEKAFNQFKALNIDIWGVESKLAHPFCDDLFGTADVIGRKGEKHIIIVDFKFGEIPVKVKNNPQLLIYARLALFRYEADCVDTCIIQPKVWDKPRISTYKAKEIESWFDENVIPAINNPDKIEMGDHCKWCPGKDRCYTDLL